MTTTGKAARKTGGNRYACKRGKRRAKHEKIFKNNRLTPEQYQKMKLTERKALAKS